MHSRSTSAVCAALTALCLFLSPAAGRAGEAEQLSDMVEVEEGGVRFLVSRENYDRFYAGQEGVRKLTPDRDDTTFAVELVRTAGYLPKTAAYFLAGSQIMTRSMAAARIGRGELQEEDILRLYRIAPSDFILGDQYEEAVARAKEENPGLTDDRARALVMGQTRFAEAKRLYEELHEKWGEDGWEVVGTVTLGNAGDAGDDPAVIAAPGLDPNTAYFLLDREKIITDSNSYLTYCILTGDVRESRVGHLMPMGQDRYCIEDEVNAALKALGENNPDMNYAMAMDILRARIDSRTPAEAVISAE